jgi:hypothetical protein
MQVNVSHRGHCRGCDQILDRARGSLCHHRRWQAVLDRLQRHLLTVALAVLDRRSQKSKACHQYSQALCSQQDKEVVSRGTRVGSRQRTGLFRLTPRAVGGRVCNDDAMGGSN